MARRTPNWSLVVSVRTPDGPRQRTLCHLGELADCDQARWLRTAEVFNAQGEAQQLKLFPSHAEPPAGNAQVACVLVNQVRLEGTRQFGACYLGLELWRRLELDHFFEQAVDHDAADVPWSPVAALLAINRFAPVRMHLCSRIQYGAKTPWKTLKGLNGDPICIVCLGGRNLAGEVGAVSARARQLNDTLHSSIRCDGKGASGQNLVDNRLRTVSNCHVMQDVRLSTERKQIPQVVANPRNRWKD